MAWEFFYISDYLGLLCSSSDAADSSAESDGLACYFALKGAEDELSGRRESGVEDVEAGPVCVVGWGG